MAQQQYKLHSDIHLKITELCLLVELINLTCATQCTYIAANCNCI